MNSIDRNKSELFNILKAQAFSRGRFVLSSGKISDYYLDARLVTLSAAGAYLTASIMLDMIAQDEIDAIGGPTLGADPMVGAIASLSYQANRPRDTFIIRKQPKAHGKQQQVEGPLLKENSRVVIIDDVATTGKAFVESIEVLQKMNIRIVKAICVIDRQEGAREALAQYKVPLESIFSITEFLQ
ncbi:MAG: orotate phosphoribosyltransferase [Candidatus Omnitrophica bacterium]|nr:orotate phosphoribosyltransferase [Candidatus Omnitrophota bacterium]